MFALRGGLMMGYDEQAGTVGFGIEYQAWTIDYAYMPFSNTSDLGDTHRFSLNWRSMPHRES